jgi:hypothetical protein
MALSKSSQGTMEEQARSSNRCVLKGERIAVEIPDSTDHFNGLVTGGSPCS